MQIVYLMIIGGKPFKIFRTKKIAKSYLEWFERMARYDANEYKDYEEFLNLNLYVGSVDNIELVELEIINEIH